jgi:hypothetical protein
MTIKMKFSASTPQALAIVCGPSIDAVGRSGANILADLAKGRVNAMKISQTPVYTNNGDTEHERKGA